MVFAFPSGLNPEVFPLAWLVGEWEGLGQISYHEQIPTARAWNHIKFSHDGGPYLKYESVIRIIGEGEQELPGAVLPAEGMDSPEVQALVQKYSQVPDASAAAADATPTPSAHSAQPFEPDPQWSGDPSSADATGPGESESDAVGRGEAAPRLETNPSAPEGETARLETTGDASEADPRTGQIWSSETGFWKVSPLRHGSMQGNEFALEVFIVDADGRMTFFNGEASPARVILASAKTVRSALASEVDGSKRMFGYVNDHLAWAEDMVAFGHELGSYASFFLERTVDGDGNTVAPE